MNEELPFREVRREQPLTEADFAAIRATVLARVAHRPRRAAARFALALAAIVAIAALALGTLVALHRQPHPMESKATQPPRLAVPTAPVPTLAAPAETVAAADARPPMPLIPRHRSRRTARRQTTALASAARASAAGAAGDAKPDITLQLQTSNPDIRIIWIERSSK